MGQGSPPHARRAWGNPVKRYLEFEGLPPREQTLGAMRAARMQLCRDLFAAAPPPGAGVLDALGSDALDALIAQGWQDVPAAPAALTRRNLARKAVREHLEIDADCLAPREHTLLERMLILGGRAPIRDADDFDAALAMRSRLWCDIGGPDGGNGTADADTTAAGQPGTPTARLDPALEAPLREALSRREHAAIRSRVFSFDAMVHALLYAGGFLDDALPRERFMADVLGTHALDARAARAARNYVESAYDCVLAGGCRLLVHEGLYAPEAFLDRIAKAAQSGGYRTPRMTPARMQGCMDGTLPEERASMRALASSIRFALRPELGLTPDEAANDLKLLAKQGMPVETLRAVLADMLLVLTPRTADSALRQMARDAVSWGGAAMEAPQSGAFAQTVTFGLLQ